MYVAKLLYVSIYIYIYHVGTECLHVAIVIKHKTTMQIIGKNETTLVIQWQLAT